MEMTAQEVALCAEIARLREQKQELLAALENIVGQEPCLQNGDCFYPMHDGEGNYIGEQNVDPLSVIQSMSTIAQEAIARTETK